MEARAAFLDADIDIPLDCILLVTQLHLSLATAAAGDATGVFDLSCLLRDRRTGGGRTWCRHSPGMFIFFSFSLPLLEPVGDDQLEPVGDDQPERSLHERLHHVELVHIVVPSPPFQFLDLKNNLRPTAPFSLLI